MGKKRNKLARLEQPPKPSTDRYPLRSKDPKPDLTAPAPFGFSVNGSEQPQGSSFQPSSQWPAANGGMNPNNGFFNYQPPQMFNGMNTFGMAMAQPGFFGGLQPMQMPFFTPNMNMGINASQTNLPAQGIPMPSSQSDVRPSTPPPNVGMASSPSSNDRERQPITAPSAASGGVPDPTPAYTMRASFLPKRREHPGPLLVVIDLNGTLLHRPDRRHGARFQARQHAEAFVTYCVETFWVVIWSSARPDNVRRMVDQLLTPESRRHVVAVWARDRFGLTEADYNARTQCYKRLTTIWEDPLVKSAYPRTRPGFERSFWNQGNTVLIDDSAEKARSEPHNAITLPSFTGGADVAADVLPTVHDYLNELCYQEDVSAYMRANPFKMA